MEPVREAVHRLVVEDGRVSWTGAVTNPGFRGEHGRRRAMRACTDAQLVAAMREGVAEAWTEFDARFRPLLETFARRIHIPTWEWSTCIIEVLDDVAIRLVTHNEAVPSSLSGYLVRAVRYRYLKLERS